VVTWWENLRLEDLTEGQLIEVTTFDGTVVRVTVGPRVEGQSSFERFMIPPPPADAQAG
jgi:hypothetical protein